MQCWNLRATAAGLRVRTRHWLVTTSASCLPPANEARPDSTSFGRVRTATKKPDWGLKPREWNNEAERLSFCIYMYVQFRQSTPLSASKPVLPDISDYAIKLLRKTLRQHCRACHSWVSCFHMHRQNAESNPRWLDSQKVRKMRYYRVVATTASAICHHFSQLNPSPFSDGSLHLPQPQQQAPQ